MVGGGPVGTRKALALLNAGAHVTVVAPLMSDELRETAKQNSLLLLLEREYSGATDIGSAQIVIAASNSTPVNTNVAADAHSLSRLVSVANSPTDGSFMSMAVHSAGPVTIGVSAGNVPSAAGRIRDAIAERFDNRYGDAVSACAELRANVLNERGSAAWAEIHPRLIGPDFCARVENATFSGEIV